jgi:hypothetical protein
MERFRGPALKRLRSPVVELKLDEPIMQQETDSLVVRPAPTFRWLAPLVAAAMAGLFAWIAVFPQTGITAFDRTIAAIGATFFLSSIVEYSQKRYVFTPHEIHSWHVYAILIVASVV